MSPAEHVRRIDRLLNAPGALHLPYEVARRLVRLREEAMRAADGGAPDDAARAAGEVERILGDAGRLTPA